MKEGITSRNIAQPQCRLAFKGEQAFCVIASAGRRPIWQDGPSLCGETLNSTGATSPPRRGGSRAGPRGLYFLSGIKGLLLVFGGLRLGGRGPRPRGLFCFNERRIWGWHGAVGRRREQSSTPLSLFPAHSPPLLKRRFWAATSGRPCVRAPLQEPLRARVWSDPLRNIPPALLSRPGTGRGRVGGVL